MSGKIEISRKLAERICGSMDFELGSIGGTGGGIEELRALLSAPVVERQPVAWLIQWGSTIQGFTGHREVVLSEPMLSDAATVTLLYTSPPAPVAVAPNESAEFNKWWGTTEVLKKNKLQIAQEAWQARACLDKVKELNTIHVGELDPAQRLALARGKL